MPPRWGDTVLNTRRTRSRCNNGATAMQSRCDRDAMATARADDRTDEGPAPEAWSLYGALFPWTALFACQSICDRNRSRA
eukprot:7329424-Lingulodinium_polyedra.AAC.1